MVKLTQEGDYRGKIIDHAVSQTKNGYPQLVANLSAIETWDEDTQEWVDFSEYDAGIMAYLCLVGGDAKPLMNMEQVMKATGWDGQSFAALDNMDLTDTVIQYRVEWEEYNGSDNLKVKWVDHKDATPGVKVKKLDPAELKSLDAKYSQTLKAASGKATPTASKRGQGGMKSAPAEDHVPPTNPAPATSDQSGDEKPQRRKRRTKAEMEAEKKAAEIPEPSPCDIETAWGDFSKTAEKAKLNGDAMNAIWISVIEGVVGDKDEDDITDEEYGQIRMKLLAHKDVCPF